MTEEELRKKFDTLAENHASYPVQVARLLKEDAWYWFKQGYEAAQQKPEPEPEPPTFARHDALVLREEFQQPYMLCLKALRRSEWNMDAARELLRTNLRSLL